MLQNNNLHRKQSEIILTNEEKRVKIYTAKGQPTKASEVTAETPLETLNLNWKEADLPERERTKHVHRLHPYLGKFIPQLIEILLRKYFRKGQVVLDPFCGSGTTLVQSNELGVNAIGYDISAFNILLCKTKTTKYDVKRLEAEVFDILEKVQAVTSLNTVQPNLWETDSLKPPVTDTDNEYLRIWFAPKTLRELLTYRHYIYCGKYKYKDLLKIILSRSARSARLTTHYDLDFPKTPQTEPYWCYKHSRECSPTNEAFKFLRRYSIDTLTRIEEFSKLRTNATVTIRHADARKAKLPPIDGIITSPPYVGLIDYHEQHAYAYHLLGLKDRRGDEIGAATNGSSVRACQEYKSNIVKVFQKALEPMRRGGKIIVIANDKFNLYGEVGTLLNVETEGILQRHVNRRTGRRSSEFYESIFIWRKP